MQGSGNGVTVRTVDGVTSWQRSGKMLPGVDESRSRHWEWGWAWREHGSQANKGNNTQGRTSPPVGSCPDPPNTSIKIPCLVPHDSIAAESWCSDPQVPWRCISPSTLPQECRWPSPVIQTQPALPMSVQGLRGTALQTPSLSCYFRELNKGSSSRQSQDCPILSIVGLDLCGQIFCVLQR